MSLFSADIMMRHIGSFTLSTLALLCLPVAALAQSAAALETLVQCQPGTTINVAQVESQLRALGLAQQPDGFFLPEAGKTVAFLGGELIAASVFAAEGEQKLSVYLGQQAAKPLAQRLSVTEIDEYADTDEPSYVKQTSDNTMLLVVSASSVDTGTQSLPFQSALVCQVNA